MEEAEKSLSVQGKRVLIIDDNLAVLKSLAEAFSRAGAIVSVAADGVSGMRCFRTQMPDLVITDLIMPDKEGIETIMEIRSAAPNLPVLAISGGGRVGAGEFLSLALTLGASDAMAKPFRSQELITRAERLLADAGAA